MGYKVSEEGYSQRTGWPHHKFAKSNTVMRLALVQTIIEFLWSRVAHWYINLISLGNVHLIAQKSVVDI